MLKPGTRVGFYEVIGAIGAGGMGEGYRARDTRLGREVALKVLPAALSANAERIGRFEREAKVLASLNHLNIGADAVLFSRRQIGGIFRRGQAEEGRGYGWYSCDSVRSSQPASSA